MRELTHVIFHEREHDFERVGNPGPEMLPQILRETVMHKQYHSVIENSLQRVGKEVTFLIAKTQTRVLR